MTTVTHYVGNTAPSLTYQVREQNEDGSTQPFVFPVGSSVRFYLREAGTSNFRVNGDPATIVNPAATTISDPDAGVVRYDWDPADVALPTGEFVGYFRITFSDMSTQDTPAFTWLLSDHSIVTVPSGTYIDVAQLKDFTGLDDLKNAPDEWLATNVIPRAEAWLSAWGPFTTSTCPQLKLAALVLAEALFQKVNPSSANVIAAGGFKSESIGNYSYTLKDAATSTSGGDWDQLMTEIGNIVAVCQDINAGAGEIVYGSTQVFTPLPGYAEDAFGGVATTFDVHKEIMLIRGYLDSAQWPWSSPYGSGGWWPS